MNRRIQLITASLVLVLTATPPLSYAGSSHWASVLVNDLQNEKLLMNVSKESKALEANMTGKQLDQMMVDIASAKKLTFATVDHSDLKTVTRLKAAEILYSAFKDQYPNYKPLQTTSSFKDVKTKNASSQKALDWVTQMGLMKGYKDGTFKPDVNMKLGEGVALVNELKKWMVAGEASIQKPDTTPVTPKGTPAKDVTYEWLQGADGTYTLNLAWGEKPTGGYSITVDHIEADGSTLNVFVKLTSPGEGAIVTQALTHPTAIYKTTYKKAEVDGFKVVIYPVK